MNPECKSNEHEYESVVTREIRGYNSPTGEFTDSEITVFCRKCGHAKTISSIEDKS